MGNSFVRKRLVDGPGPWIYTDVGVLPQDVTGLGENAEYDFDDGTGDPLQRLTTLSAAGFATASDLWEREAVSSVELTTQAMSIGDADADRRVLFLYLLQGKNNPPNATYDFTVNAVSQVATPLQAQWASGACVLAYDVSVPTGATATVGIMNSQGSANTVIAIPHLGNVVDSDSSQQSGGAAFSGVEVATVVGGTLHVGIFGDVAHLDPAELVITSPSGAVLVSTIVTENDILAGAHPNRAANGRAYIKLENTPAGFVSISIDNPTDASTGRWSLVAVSLDN